MSGRNNKKCFSGSVFLAFLFYCVFMHDVHYKLLMYGTHCLLMLTFPHCPGLNNPLSKSIFQFPQCDIL